MDDDTIDYARAAHVKRLRNCRQDRYAKYVSVHPGFSPLNLQNDFALIHLSEPFLLAPHIDVACLPDNLHSENRCQSYKTFFLRC